MRRIAVVLALAAALAAGADAGLFAQRAVSPAPDAGELAGLTLRNIGPANMSGRIVDIAVVESDPSIVYAASATGGLWKTTDNGVTWAPLFERESVHSIGAIAVFQPKPEIVWIGSGEAANRQSSGWGDGVYKSADGGKTWTNVGLRDSKHVGRIVLHPTDPDVVYVAAVGHLWGPNPERGLYKSTDGGATWRAVLAVDENTGVIDVAMDPSDARVMYAASYQRRRTAFGFNGGGPGSALWKSTDGGDTWRRLTTDLPAGDKGRIGISIYRKDPRVVYVCIEQGERYNASTAYEQRKAGIYRSEDRGEHWTHMSDWNPRPMYASQIRVDPNDDRRIYMVNAYSFSDDGGKTFTVPKQSLHGDDRVVWIDPRDSRHVIKGDDGGLGISYDRGLKWLFVSSLPVSQWYRISVDHRKPYWVYGGLQDNGSWAGPSATYFSTGILNEDWIRTGGGDGFFSVKDPSDDRTVYVNSQFLGLTRVDMATHEKTDIRPAQPKGFIEARRNWTVWGTGRPDPELGNAMTPANWDAAFAISPHDPHTIFAGTNVLWKSSDRGQTWTSLGDRTTGVDRATLPIMGQMPSRDTLSIDDGVPYYPGITAIAESPLAAGLMYVGTDDGNLQVSEDGGATWTDVSARLPGAPSGSWIAGIEPSRHRAGTVYVTLDNHRSDDYANYVYVSTDRGASWNSIVGDLPEGRVARTIREDPKRAGLLYLATETGLFVSIDAGAHWLPLGANMPRVAVNDLLVHPRDNDLVVATHGLGVWILDKVGSLQELTPEIVASPSHLFAIAPAEMIRFTNPKAHAGDLIFRGENPPAGAIVDYWLGSAASKVALSIHDAAGTQVSSVTTTTKRGLNRVIWNLRYPQVAAGREATDDAESGSGPIPGPFVVPGEYTVRLTVDGRALERKVEVTDDPRLSVAPSARVAWTQALLEIADVYRSATSMAEAAARVVGPAQARSASDEARETARLARELQARAGTLYRAVSSSTGPLTADQRSQLEYFASMARLVEKRLQ